jgi:DNA-binding transcriptional ArsR family regulator
MAMTSQVVSAVPLDAYVLDVLMPDLVGHDRRPSAFLVYLYLWRRTRGGRDAEVPVALREIAEGTGLAKRSVQTALARLTRRRLVTARRDGRTAVSEYAVLRPWVRRA